MAGPGTVGESELLTAEDVAILTKESPTVVGHICKVFMLGSALDVDTLRASMGHRVAALPPLTRRLGGTTAAPAWVDDPAFCIDDHVVDGTCSAALTAEEVIGQIVGLFTERLDRNRPLWRIDVLGPLEDGGSALVWRIHHALADGQTSMRFATAILWDVEDGPSSTSSTSSRAAAAHREHRRHRRDLAGFVEREFRREAGPSPFDGQIGAQRAIAVATAPLEPLRRAARAVAEATVNDAVLACVTGGLRRWMEPDGGQLNELRVKVPVSMHHADDSLGNRDSCFYLGLPVGEPDAATRLRLIRQESALRKANHDAEELDWVMRALSRVSPRLRLLCDRFQFNPREFALNVSNVPGPSSPVSVVGRPVRDMYSIADIAERHALRVGVISYHDQLTFGLCADATLVPDLEGLAAAIEVEAAELVALAP
jgi:diacylglycerol O-acyltransferase